MTRTLPETPQRKSDRTRAAILNAARGAFGARGYDVATVRDIAAAAGVDAALVIRYFGSKEELFVRAAEIDLSLPDFSAVPQAALGEAVVRHFLDLWEMPDGNPGLAVILRSAASNDFARQRMREVFESQVAPALARAAADDAPTRAGLIASQLLGLALARYLLHLPPIAAMPAAEIVRHVAPTVQRYLTGRG